MTDEKPVTVRRDEFESVVRKLVAAAPKPKSSIARKRVPKKPPTTKATKIG